jgi:hypothetical protein
LSYSTWSTVSRPNSDGWPESSSDGGGQPESKDPWPVTTQSSSAAFTDLVPEFEPGKPWKVMIVASGIYKTSVEQNSGKLKSLHRVHTIHS